MTERTNILAHTIRGEVPGAAKRKCYVIEKAIDRGERIVVTGKKAAAIGLVRGAGSELVKRRRTRVPRLRSG